MTGYYDYVLGLIPLALVGITAVLTLAGLSLTSAVPLGAGVSGLVVGHALFINAPIEDPKTTRRTQSLNAE